MLDIAGENRGRRESCRCDGRAAIMQFAAGVLRSAHRKRGLPFADTGALTFGCPEVGEPGERLVRRPTAITKLSGGKAAKLYSDCNTLYATDFRFSKY